MQDWADLAKYYVIIFTYKLLLFDRKKVWSKRSSHICTVAAGGKFRDLSQYNKKIRIKILNILNKENCFTKFKIEDDSHKTIFSASFSENILFLILIII